MIKRIVLTGGPCSGKSTVLKAVKAEFGERVTVVPEAATLLLEGGFPLPGRELEWSEAWQTEFQTGIASLQTSLESGWELVARERGQSLMVCDRGLLDGAAYTPGGVSEFCRRFQVDQQAALGRYRLVLHLESLATAQPEAYGQINNSSRFEPLERAQELEFKTREAWATHPRHLFITGRSEMQLKIDQVIKELRKLSV